MASQIKRLLYVNFYKLTKFEQIFPEYSQTFLKLFSRYILMKFSATKQSKWIFNHWCFLIEKIVLIFAVFSLKDDRIKSFFSKKNFFLKKGYVYKCKYLNLLLKGVAFAMYTDLFSFCSVNTIEACSAVIFSLTGDTFSARFSLLTGNWVRILLKIEKFLPFDSYRRDHRACHKSPKTEEAGAGGLTWAHMGIRDHQETLGEVWKYVWNLYLVNANKITQYSHFYMLVWPLLWGDGHFVISEAKKLYKITKPGQLFGYFRSQKLYKITKPGQLFCNLRSWKLYKITKPDQLFCI